MTRQERTAKLMALLTVGFCWALKLGQWAVTKKIMQLKIKNFKDGKRPQKNLFRLGLDFIREAFISPKKLIEHFDDILRVFKVPLKNFRGFFYEFYEFCPVRRYFSLFCNLLIHYGL